MSDWPVSNQPSEIGHVSVRFLDQNECVVEGLDDENVSINNVRYRLSARAHNKDGEWVLGFLDCYLRRADGVDKDPSPAARNKAMRCVVAAINAAIDESPDIRMRAELVEYKRLEKEAVEAIRQLDEKRRDVVGALEHTRDSQRKIRQALNQYRVLEPNEVLRPGDEAIAYGPFFPPQGWFPVVEMVGEKLGETRFESARRPLDLDTGDGS